MNVSTPGRPLVYNTPSGEGNVDKSTYFPIDYWIGVDSAWDTCYSLYMADGPKQTSYSVVEAQPLEQSVSLFFSVEKDTVTLSRYHEVSGKLDYIVMNAATFVMLAHLFVDDHGGEYL